MKLEPQITNNHSSLIDNQSKRRSTTVENSLQIHPFYAKQTQFHAFFALKRRFHEKTKPIQTQFKPNLTQNKANLSQNKPNQSQFQHLIHSQKATVMHNFFPKALFPLTSSTARDYNGVFSQISCSQRTPIERSWK